MEDLHAQAQLVAFDRARSVGTVVGRDEIAEAAAGAEFPATLLLDIDRVETVDGGEVKEQAKIAVDWDQETLQQLLAATEDKEIALWFDERELVRAFEEVEAHGLRQRVAVLAVAVAAAGASASPSLATFAADTSGGGGGGAATPAFNMNPQAGGHGAVAQSAGAERALQQDEKIAVTQSQAGAPAATSSTGDSTLSTGELAAAVAAGALLISAAGFGATRKRQPPAQPA